MTEELRNALLRDERYSGFTLFDSPQTFRDLFKDKDFTLVQVHDVTVCSIGKIVGFSGVFKWCRNEIFSLDGDSYSSLMSVVGYNRFIDSEGNQCLDVLVEDW